MIVTSKVKCLVLSIAALLYVSFQTSVPPLLDPSVAVIAGSALSLIRLVHIQIVGGCAVVAMADS